MSKLDLQKLNIARDSLDEALRGIYCAFDWSAHPDGVEYWQDVADRLEGIVEAMPDESESGKDAPT